MTNLEKYVLQKGQKKVDDYMAALGYKSCTIYGNNNSKVTYNNHPTRSDVTIIFSEKGRAKQVIYENNI